MKHLKYFTSISTIFFLLNCILALPRTDPPTDPGHPFLFMWNVPSELCEVRFGVTLDLSHFHLISSTLKAATNQPISIFYTDRYGIFPYIDEDTGEMYDDGLPQLVDLKEHRDHAEDDIEYYIPVDNPGLAILDFEEWRPQWIRNWGSKNIYKEISIAKVKNKTASLTDDEAEARAKIVFERAAKRYFLRSINLGKKMRPKRQWGYYLYPDCYNYDFNQDMVGYTGECPDIEKARNDNLLWLWNASTALYPSIYLEEVLQDSMQARMFVRHRMKEKIGLMRDNDPRSVFESCLLRNSFDLVNTIGEASALGAAGVVSWGDMNITDNEDSCFDARRHLEQVMNNYILNVSTATQLCSEALWQRRGRCVRKQWDSDVFLHLDHRRYRIERLWRGGPLVVRGGLSQDDVDYYDTWFDCMCYTEQPCRAPLMLNTINEDSVTKGNSAGAQRMSVYVLLMVGLMWNSVSTLCV
ncbi:hyaluronidase-5-like [Eucyclogobius newberryi]|uniref:hyaluronidase-5-like n=1 Tax=Eucyclogobius newberryi TaxID=166745 RepID=UPI003B5C0718